MPPFPGSSETAPCSAESIPRILGATTAVICCPKLESHSKNEVTVYDVRFHAEHILTNVGKRISRVAKNSG